jgi:two-component system sensor histidine kinase UhpB
VKESEHVDELLALLDWLPASVALWDHDVRLRYGNRRALARFGRPRNQLLGAHLSELVQPQAVELSAQYIDGALAGQPQQVERAMVDRHGRRYNAHQVTHIPNVVDGAVAGYCALAVDITASIEGYEHARHMREQAALRTVRERIVSDINSRHVVHDLCGALERLEGALGRATDALPSLSTAADTIDRTIEELRAMVPARMIDKPHPDEPRVAFPSLSVHFDLGCPEASAGGRVGVPCPPDITGRGWSAEDACALLDLLPAEIAIWDACLRNVFANRAAVRLFGRATRKDALGEHARDLLGAGMFEAANVAYAEAALLGQPTQLDRTVAHSSGLRHLQMYYAPRIHSGEVDGIYSVVVDVTPRVEADLALQDARAALASARERGRIADRLHSLVIERLFAAGLAARHTAPAVADTQVRLVEDTILDVLEDLRSAIATLHENVGLLDLLPDLARLVHDAAQPNNIAVAIENVGSVEYVPTAVGAELLAVAKAALSNVAMHSGASNVVVTIAADAAGVWLRVADDGRGIGAETGKRIADMATRAARLGGTCTWHTDRRSGTRVDFRVPLPQ